MGEITKGQQIRITAPLTVTRIGTADLEVEYPAGSINLKLNIPKKICEPIESIESTSGWISHPVSLEIEPPGMTTTNAKPNEYQTVNIPREITAVAGIATNDYKTHIDLASQIKPEYKCDICGKICTARIGLAGHKRSHKLKSPVVST